MIGNQRVELLHRDGAAKATRLALAGFGRAGLVAVASSLLSVIALPHAAQKQMPVRRVGPLTTRGAVSAGLRDLRRNCTASKSAALMIGGTAISTISASVTDTSSGQSSFTVQPDKSFAAFRPGRGARGLA